jgi:hypothetical protein
MVGIEETSIDSSVLSFGEKSINQKRTIARRKTLPK